MEFKTNIKFNIKTSIRCPKCKEKFDKPASGDTPTRCPHCGARLKLSKDFLDDAMRESESKAAGTLGNMGIPLPQNYADIAKAKVVTKTLNIIGVIATMWAIFFPFPYTLAVILCALIPMASIITMAIFKGLISFETKKKKTGQPYLTFALAAPPCALTWRALNDFHIFEYDNVWIPMVILSIIFSILTYLFAADVKRKPAYILVTLIFGLAYGYGLVLDANCLPDNSVPKTYTATVLGKRSSYSSRSRYYYIKVTPWGPRNEQNEISVKKRSYDLIKQNDEISISMKEGMLNIPWFYIQLKK